MDYKLFNQNKKLTILEQVLINRGIKEEDIQHYLNTTNDDIIDPSLIKNIYDGIKLLIYHISQQNKIFIQVDSDCDGFTSAAFLINYLYKLFPTIVENNLIYDFHEGKQHGIDPTIIPEGTKLIIAPDSSSNDYDVHEYLKQEKNIDILVIDHHEADYESKYACIINNQLCDYPNKTLSGVGMVYKFCQIIDNLLNINYADDFLDLVALGLIGDMMDLRNFETKHLIEKGLSNVQNPFFKAMIEKQSYVLKNELSPLGVAFYIAPYVNATIRVGSQREKRILFESMLNEKGFQEIESTKRGCKGQKETKVEQSCRNCTNLKNLQKKIRDNILLRIEEKIVNEKLLDNKILIIVFDKNDTINKNLTGLIANQLMAKYQKPVLILNKTIYTKKEPSNDWERWLQKNNKQKENNQVIFEGSARGYEKSKFKNFKDFLNDSNLVLYAEGHQNALGVGILEKNLNKFIEYSNNKLKDVNFNPYYNVDFLYNVNTINKTDILEIADLKHIWGQGIEEPLIMIEGINVPSGSLTLMAKDKHPTLKITLPNGISLIKFGSSEEEYQSLYSNLGCVKINIIGKCEKNIWNGIISPQIMIEDYEVIERAQYYF